MARKNVFKQSMSANVMEEYQRDKIHGNCKLQAENDIGEYSPSAGMDLRQRREGA